MNTDWARSKELSSVRLWYHRALNLGKHFVWSSSSLPSSPAFPELKPQPFQCEWRQPYTQHNLVVCETKGH